VTDRIEVHSSGRVIADRARWARTWRERSRGLLKNSPLQKGEALIIEPASQVHTFGMKYEIDVVFCARDWSVKHVVGSMRPKRVTRWVFGARYAVELPSGTLGKDLRPGDVLRVTRATSSG
jgi:uncharacterized membrane protein (UPF0127 family)